MNVFENHIERFNAAVRSGDFDAMADGFADDAVMEFQGVPVGPFHGREEIRAAYRAQPPDDELRVLDRRDDDRRVVAGYAWLKEPDRRAGEIRLEHDGQAIRHLVVTFE